MKSIKVVAIRLMVAFALTVGCFWIAVREVCYTLMGLHDDALGI